MICSEALEPTHCGADDVVENRNKKRDEQLHCFAKQDRAETEKRNIGQAFANIRNILPQTVPLILSPFIIFLCFVKFYTS
jgi:hypothetical protein